MKRRQYVYQNQNPTALTGAVLLSEAIERFTLASRARQLSPHTLADYSRTFRKFLIHVGDTPIDEIAPAQIAAFLAAQPFTAKTVLNYHIGLAALWTWANREGITARHIPRVVERPKPQKVAVIPLTEADIRAMLAAVGKRAGLRDRAVILLLLDTGLRASELCGLAMPDIDLVNDRLKVLGKGNKERLLPFSPTTRAALLAYLEALPDGRRAFDLSRTSLARLVHDIGERAKVKNAHPHRFRHTFAVMYLRNGGDPYTLQDILGHSTLDMVKTYLHLAQVDAQTAHRRASPVTGWGL